MPQKYPEAAYEVVQKWLNDNKDANGNHKKKCEGRERKKLVSQLQKIFAGTGEVKTEKQTSKTLSILLGRIRGIVVERKDSKRKIGDLYCCHPIERKKYRESNAKPNGQYHFVCFHLECPMGVDTEGVYCNDCAQTQNGLLILDNGDIMSKDKPDLFICRAASSSGAGATWVIPVGMRIPKHLSLESREELSNKIRNRSSRKCCMVCNDTKLVFMNKDIKCADCVVRVHKVENLKLYLGSDEKKVPCCRFIGHDGNQKVVRADGLRGRTHGGKILFPLELSIMDTTPVELHGSILKSLSAKKDRDREKAHLELEHKRAHLHEIREAGRKLFETNQKKTKGGGTITPRDFILQDVTRPDDRDFDALKNDADRRHFFHPVAVSPVSPHSHFFQMSPKGECVLYPRSGLGEKTINAIPHLRGEDCRDNKVWVGPSFPKTLPFFTNHWHYPRYNPMDDEKAYFAHYFFSKNPAIVGFQASVCLLCLLY